MSIGIDLGTTNSVVGIFINDHVEIIPNEYGSRFTPSIVGFTKTHCLVGEAVNMYYRNLNLTSFILCHRLNIKWR